MKTQKTVRNMENYWKPAVVRIFLKYKTYIEEKFNV